MIQGTYPLAASMINQLNRLDVVTNNLANVNTTGFKEERVVEGSFNDYLNRATNEDTVTEKMNVVTNTIPKIDGKFIVENQGATQITGNQLDFSFNTPNTYFKVLNKNGEIEYTRDGNFNINQDGMLVTSSGYNVLNADNEPIVSEEGFEQLISIAQIDSQNLEKVGNNNYKALIENQVDVLVGNEGYLLQGSLEKSNVSAVKAMVELIEASRRLEQTQKAITAKGEITDTLIEKIGLGN